MQYITQHTTQQKFTKINTTQRNQQKSTKHTQQKI
jgi:hypothetical protein